MENALKLIIPLIDDRLKLEDLSEDVGFIDAYSIDDNQPHLQNHIFLLYYHDFYEDDHDLSKVSLSFIVSKKLNKIPSLHHSDRVKIDGRYYSLYTFNITNTEAKNVKLGKFPEKVENRNRIIYFWKMKDRFINEYSWRIDDRLKWEGTRYKGSKVPEYRRMITVEEEFLNGL